MTRHVQSAPAARLRARAAGFRLLATALVWALSASVVLPSGAAGLSAEAGGLRLIRTPAIADGYRGWTTRPTAVTIVPLEPGTVYYTWGSPLGGWQLYRGDIMVPEGKNTLRAVLVPQGGGAPIPVFAEEFRFDPEGAVRGFSPATLAATSGTQVLVHARVNPHTGARIVRLGGRDRYETSALISAENFPTSDTVIIATGEKFADALTSSGLAGCESAPILLTKRMLLPATVASEIVRLGARRAIIVGGEAAVSANVVTQLRGVGVSVERIGGADRYETAALIGARVVSFGQHGGRVFVARGDDFADALALGPLAYAAKAPLVLVKPASVPSATRSFLSANAFSSGCVAGGTVAVSEGVAAILGGYVPGIVRLAGSSRYSTATTVATWGYDNGLCDLGNVGIATGTDFADALCGGAAAGANGGVILLTRPGELNGDSANWLALNVGGLRDLQVFGGERAISPGVVDTIQGITR